MRVLEVSKIKILRCMRSWLKTIIQCQDIFRVMTKLWLNKQHLKILFYLTNRTRLPQMHLICHESAQKKRFFCILTVFCFDSHLFTCMHTKQWQKIIFSVQSVNLGTHNYRVLLRNLSKWLNSRYKMVLLPLAFVGFAILPPFSNP